MNTIEAIVTDDNGTIRIKSSRVSLEAVVYQFKLGATAEQIQEDFPSLSLREVYDKFIFTLITKRKLMSI